MAKKNAPLLHRLLEEGWFCSEEQALPWAMLGNILVNNQPVYSVKQTVPLRGEIRIKEYHKLRYVNKGGLKLEAALSQFDIPLDNCVALDCGASTGGFTDCLLQYGAKQVYAVDVGHGQLAGKLQQDSRVINLENTNLSCESLRSLSPPPTVITLDLSFLSLTDAVPICLDVLEQGDIIALIKPLFEVECAQARRTGEIDSPALLEETLSSLCQEFSQKGLHVLGLIHSPIRGNNGTVEFFVHLRRSKTPPKESLTSADWEPLAKLHTQKALALSPFEASGVNPFYCEK